VVQLLRGGIHHYFALKRYIKEESALGRP
jgi:hypothetical protein